MRYSLIFCSLASLFPLFLAAKLVIYSPGPRGRPILDVSTGKRRVKNFCPRDHRRGITIRCTTKRRDVRFAKFIVYGRNGRRLLEVVDRSAPFTIRNDNGAGVWRFGRFVFSRENLRIRCKLNNGRRTVDSVTARIRIKCGSGTSGRVVPGSGGNTIVKRVNDNTCMTRPAVLPSGPNWRDGADFGHRGCAAYQYRNFEGKIFKPEDAGASMEYSFTPESSGTYSVSVIMYTNGGTEHNDIWMQWQAPSGEPNGFILRKRDEKRSESGWVKGYHNVKETYFDEIYSVDHNAHTFSTKPLKAGKTYKLLIKGRSTRVAICGVMLFKCNPAAEECRNGSGFRSNLDACKSKGV